jgi:trans-aconitate methyltransferase
MHGYGAQTYGEAFADIYDEWYSDISDVETCVAALTELSRGGPILELGVGTGRLALPLAAAGADVHGVDASPAMLDKLAAADPQGSVTVTEADFGSQIPKGPFNMVFAAYNTLFNLVTAEAQQRCLQLVAGQLAPGGYFAVEAFVPSPESSSPHRGVDVKHVAESVVLNATIRDPEAQTVRGQQIQLTNNGVRLRPWQIRYLTPLQLDASCAEAGLELAARWGDWAGDPFDDHSTRHVSIYAARTR